MFALRKEHLEAFARAARESFEDRMVLHLRRRFRAQCQKLGEQRLRARIREGVQDAAEYEIKTERDVAQFLRLTFLLGPHFGKSWTTRWTRRWLEQRDTSAAIRLHRLLAEARRRGHMSERVVARPADHNKHAPCNPEGGS